MMTADHFHPGGIGRAADKGSDPRGLIRAANRTTIAAIVDGVVGNESLLALIGEAGTGKTTLASMLREELASGSVRVLLIDKGGSGEISVRQIVAEVLGGPQSELTSADVRTFIEVMTRRKEPAQRLVLVIDDAECLQPDALSCLLLLASLPRAVAAQVIFFGRPRFWRVLGHTDGAEGNGLIRRQWELAEPPGWGRRTHDQVEVRNQDDDPSADAPAPENAAAKLGERQETAEPMAKPPRRRRYLNWVAAAAVAMVVASPMPLPQAPARLADDAPTKNSKLGGRVRGDQPSVERMGGTTLATTQVDPADPRFPTMPAPPDTEAADARLTSQPRVGVMPSAVRTNGEDSSILPNVAGAAMQAPVNPPDGAGTVLLAASPAPRTEAPALAGAYEAAELDILQPPEQPSVAVTTKDIAPHPLADAAPVPGKFSGTEPPASIAHEARRAVAEAASQAADSATRALSGTPEPPGAAARPPADTLIEATSSEAAAAPAAAETSGRGDLLAATDSAAIEPTENTATAATAETAPHVEERSKAREPLLVDEPPHVAATETNAPHSSREIALAQPEMPPAAEQPPANATAKSISPQPPPSEAAPVVAQASGAPSAPAVVVAPPSASASTAVATDKGQAGGAVLSRLHPPPDATPPLDLTLLLSRADSMLGLGDISAARRLYERAAALGSARAATAAGKTYDAAFLATIRAQGIVPDQAAASEWYRKAVALGDREAADRLAKLTPRN